MLAKYKIGDRFVEELGDTTFFINIIGIAPEIDSQGYITYFTKIEYLSDTEEGFYFDAQSQGYLEDCTEQCDW